MASFKIRQDEVDRGIFEVLRLECVKRGYLPDFVIAGNSSTYNSMKASIISSGKQIIEVFNVGSAKSKGEEYANSIIIDRGHPAPAKTGVGMSFEYDLDAITNKYKKSATADSKFDIMYMISYTSNTEKYAIIIEDIIRTCFGIRKEVKSLDENANVTGVFWVRYAGEANMSTADFIERMVQYTAVNIDLIGDTYIEDIAPVENIEVSTSFMKDEIDKKDVQNIIDKTIEMESNNENLPNENKLTKDFTIDIDIS